MTAQPAVKTAKLHEHLRSLAAALRQLEKPGGRIARRNARRLVMATLRKIKDRVDLDFPAIRSKVTGRKRRAPNERMRALMNRGYVRAINPTVLARVASAGIRPIVVRGAGGDSTTTTLLPQWACEIASHAPGKLTRAKRDLRERKALLTEIALRDQGPAFATW